MICYHNRQQCSFLLDFTLMQDFQSNVICGHVFAMQGMILPPITDSVHCSISIPSQSFASPPPIGHPSLTRPPDFVLAKRLFPFQLVVSNTFRFVFRFTFCFRPFLETVKLAMASLKFAYVHRRGSLHSLRVVCQVKVSSRRPALM